MWYTTVPYDVVGIRWQKLEYFGTVYVSITREHAMAQSGTEWHDSISAYMSMAGKHTTTEWHQMALHGIGWHKHTKAEGELKQLIQA